MISAVLNLSTMFLAAGVATETQFTYDALGRLAKASYGNGTVIEYQYDAAGNRIQKAVTASTASAGRIIILPLNGYTVIKIP